jgi:hypothetical protein
MWYSAIRSNAIGYVTSTNGVDWIRFLSGPVLEHGSEGTWDEAGVSDPYIIKASGTYTMWYESWTGSGRIGCATSADGINWVKCTANPVLEPGDTGDWDETAVHDPVVFQQDGIYHMWYQGTGPEGMSQVGYVTSTNGTEWIRFLTGPVLSGTDGEWDEGRISLGDVFFDGAGFHMWYGANGQIGYATSTDGVSWTKSISNPVLSLGAPGEWGQPAATFQGSGDSTALDGFTITGGDARSGGGIHVTNGSKVRIANATVVGNTAYWGGGLHIDKDSSAVVDSCIFRENTAVDSGGGIRLLDRALLTMTNSLVVRNVVLSEDEGAFGGLEFACCEAGGRLMNVTVAGNYSPKGMAGIRHADPDWPLTIVNSIIYHNRSTDLICEGDGCTVTYSDVEGGWPGEGNIGLEPGFVDLWGGDVRLQAWSPCIDAGTPSGAPATDIDGTPRDANPDMGAYEWRYRIFLPLILKSLGP